jgi:hypothetical protein
MKTFIITRSLGFHSITEALKASRAFKVDPERYFVQRYIFSDLRIVTADQ